MVQLLNASGMIGTIIRSGSNGLTSDEAEIAEASVFNVGKQAKIAGASVFNVENECKIDMRSVEHARQQQQQVRFNPHDVF